jgi:5-methylcytosine-specific restriction enzyme A
MEKNNLKFLEDLKKSISMYIMGRKKLNFSRKDFTKSNAQEAGFKTKTLAIKFWKTTPKNDLSNFDSVDELTNYIKTQKNKLENIGIDVNSVYKQKPRNTKNKNKKLEALETKLKQYDEKNKVKKFHITAEIQRKITYTKPKKQYEYALDSILDSRVIEASSEKEAKEIMAAEIQAAFEYDEYSGCAAINLDNVNFIDTVNESKLTTQDPTQMKMKYIEHVDYSFTQEEKKFLNADHQLTGTCVIDNFVGMYGKKLKLTRDDFIKLHQDYYKGVFENSKNQNAKIHQDNVEVEIQPNLDKEKDYIIELETELNKIESNNLKAMKSQKKLYLKRMNEINKFIENINNNIFDAPIPQFDMQFDIFETDIINEQGIKVYNKPNLEECNKNIQFLETQLNEMENKFSKLIKFEQDEILNIIQKTKEYINRHELKVDTCKDGVENSKPNDMWTVEDGITPLFLEYVCKKYDISHYAYDINNECFMKYVSKNQNHKALIYYAINDHMYLVRDEYKASLAARAREENKINTSLLEGREKTNAFHDMDIIENIDFNDVEKYAKQSCVFMFSRNIHNINDIFHLFLSKYNLIPSVDKTHKTNILQFTHNNNGVIHIYAADPNEIKIITYKQVKYLCEQNDIEFKNQTYMQFVKQMKDNFFNAKMGRIKRTKEEREEILKRFNNVCNICKCNIKESYEIDHIRPLANGGKEEKSNLQPLCKACHRDKCSNEHENGDYIRIIDSESSFNNHIQSVMDSPLSQTHAFIEPIVDDVDESRKIFNIDINKCRKNILYYGNDDYCVFTVFDKVRKYKPRNSIKKGLYYVSSDNYMPLRGNGWYYHNMIKYCLDNGIITHDNIRYEIISSLSIPFDYYNEFIDHCYKNIDNYDIICEKLNMMVDEMKDYKKLAINGMIGGFKPNLNKRANWSSLCITNNSSEAFTNYVKNDGAFIHAFNVDDKKYFHALKQGYKTNLETEAPVYNQILQQEQIELHKLMMLVQANNGTVLDVNTDAVSCIFEGDKLPFQMLDDINIKGYYYDDKKMMPKYKIEDKGRLKSARLSNNIRKDHYIHDIQYKWNIIPDVNDNNFEPLVNKIFSSGESWFITGPGGAGKSHLINMIKERFKEVDVKEEETHLRKKIV